MADAAGRGGRISVAEDDAAWGAVGTPDRAFYTRSSNIQTAMNVEFREDLNEGLSGSVMTSFHNAGIGVAGDFEVEPAYEGFGLILYHALWGTTATTGAGPYVHTYLMAASPPTVGLTIEQTLGTGLSPSEKFSGCRINTLELSVSAKGRMTARVSVIGKSGGGRAATTSTTVTTNHSPILHHQAGAVSWNSITMQTVDLALKIDNRFEANNVLGSQYTVEPYISGPRIVEVDVTVLMDANTLYAAYLAGTQADLTVTFTSGAASMAITLHNAVITKCDVPLNSHGRIMQSITLRGLSDGADYGVGIVVTNTQSSRVAA